MLTVRNNEIRISYKNSAKLKLNIKNSDGTPYIPNSGDSIVFTLKKFPNTDEVLLTKTIGQTLELNFSVEDTSLPIATYWYDIKVNLVDLRVETIVKPTQFIIEAVVNNE